MCECAFVFVCLKLSSDFIAWHACMRVHMCLYMCVPDFDVCVKY